MIRHLNNFPTTPEKSLKYQSVLGYTNVRSTCRVAAYLNNALNLTRLSRQTS